MTRNQSKTSGQSFDRLRIKAIYDEIYPRCEATLQGQYRQVRALLEREGFTPTIKYRIKRFEPYFQKLLRNAARNGTAEPAPITDLFGLRIISPFLEDVDRVEQLLQQHFDVVETVRKGSEHSFREFAYDSVHLLTRLESDPLKKDLPAVKPVCEIQLRTTLQDAWAEVEHELVYKSSLSLPNDTIRRKLASLNATLTLSDLIFQEIRDFQNELREKDDRRRQMMTAKSEPVPYISLANGGTEAERLQQEELVCSVSVGRGSELERCMLQALQLHSSGEFREAVVHYTRLLRMKMAEPVRSLIYNHRGMAHFSLGDYNSALKDFNRCLERDESNCRGLNNRALTYRILQRFHLALADYEQSLKLNPLQVDVHWGRAQTFYAMKLFAEALQECEAVLHSEPDHQPAQNLSRQIRQELL